MVTGLNALSNYDRSFLISPSALTRLQQNAVSYTCPQIAGTNSALAVVDTLGDCCDEETQSIAQQNILEVFVRDGCPHCTEAEVFLSDFGRNRPWLRIVYRSVDREPKARDDLIGHFQNAPLWPPGVRTFVFNGKVLVGFDDAERSGPLLEALVGQTSSVPGKVETKVFGTLSASQLGLPLFTLAIGLLDGFNPCAMWVLLFLLSLLVHLHDRKRMALIAGTFVL